MAEYSKPSALVQDVVNRISESLSKGTPLADVASRSVLEFNAKASSKDVGVLEDQLQEIFRSRIDHANIQQFAGFISVLHALLPVLPPISIVTTWFDITLRPSFQTPKLSRDTVILAKELVLHGLSDGSNPRTADFRRMIINLYLFGVINESSKDDMMEHVALDPAEQERQRIYKVNLEEILLGDAIQQPKYLLEQINDAFQAPDSRLQLVVFLSQLARVPELSVLEFANSSLFASLLMCLQVDLSTTVLSVAISVLIMLLPQMAMAAPDTLNNTLPKFLSILYRVICWNDRKSSVAHADALLLGQSVDHPAQNKTTATEGLAEGINWQCLESSFDRIGGPAPDARLFFQFLYGLWPTNVLNFLRRPLGYLKDSGFRSPFKESWDEVIDVDEVHSKAKPILRTHIIHPSIILQDYKSELADHSRWTDDGMDVPALVFQCISLDVRNAAAAFPHRAHSHQAQLTSVNLAVLPMSRQEKFSPKEALDAVHRAQLRQESANAKTPTATHSQLPTEELPEGESNRVPSPPPIQELVATHVVLKSSVVGSDIASSSSERSDSRPLSPRVRQLAGLPPESASPSHPPTPLSPDLTPSTPPVIPTSFPLPPSLGASPRLRFKPLVALGDDPTEPNNGRALEVISILQREVLLLRNELNFELWLKKQHLTHMGRLHRDRIIARSEEAERHSLHNSFKQMTRLYHNQLKEYEALKKEATTAKANNQKWVDSLQARVTRFRDEKKSWATEATELRGKVDEAEKAVQKQRQLLEETESERLKLRLKLDEIAPKVAKAQEYEKTIEQLMKQQLLWDDSPEMREYRQQKAQIDHLTSECSKMQQLIQSLEAANKTLEDLNNEQRRALWSAEHRANSPIAGPRSSRSMSHGQGSPRTPVGSMGMSHERFLAMETEFVNLRAEKRQLQEKVEELEEMVEVLRARSTRRGSINYPRSLESSVSSLMGPFAPQ